jgi:ATP-dependent Clp protease ATP-binding subunit ClpA
MRTRSALTDITTINALLTGAENLALESGQSPPGAEHLLVSALALPDGTARETFERAGADPDELRAAISSARVADLRVAGGLAPETSEVTDDVSTGLQAGQLPKNPSAQQTFQVAVRLSKASKPSQLLGAHVVLAVCQQEHGSAIRALQTMGIEPSKLRTAAEEVLDG